MRSKRNQTATLWSSTGENKYGESTFAGPILIDVRWEDRTEQVRKPNGEEIVSEAVVYVAEGIGAYDDYIALGDHSAVDDPTMAGAREVQVISEIPSIRAASVERRLIL